MGLLKRLLGAPEPQAVEVTAQLEQRVSIVGESNYQPALQRACGAGPTGDVSFDCMAELVPEPNNEYDPNAIMVRIGSECVGYLSRTDAVRLGPLVTGTLAAGQPTLCRAWIGRRAESGNPNMGVVLTLPTS